MKTTLLLSVLLLQGCLLQNGNEGAMDQAIGANEGNCPGFMETCELTCLDANCPGQTFKACSFDSDCFIRECTNSTCVDGTCRHVPYPDGEYCFDGVGTDIFSGQCRTGACIPLQPRG